MQENFKTRPDRLFAIRAFQGNTRMTQETLLASFVQVERIKMNLVRIPAKTVTQELLTKDLGVLSAHLARPVKAPGSLIMLRKTFKYQLVDLQLSSFV